VGREDEATGWDLPEASPLPPACGDGSVDPGEECDDGNRLNGDGCDWLCRINSDPFEYPPPDPDARPVEPTGPPLEVTDETEMSAFVAADFACTPLWLAAGGGRFALAYNYDQPYYGVRLRILDRAGHTVGEPWDHETRWELFDQALFPTDDGFGLLSGSSTYGLMRSRFALDGAPIEELRALRPSFDTPPCPWYSLAGGAHAPGRSLATSFYFGCGDNSWLLETFADDGAPVGRILIHIAFLFHCVSAVSTESGFAVGDGNKVVVLNHDLEVISWSGAMSGLGGSVIGEPLGSMDLSSDDLWIAWADRPPDGYPGTRSIWVAALDLDGTLRFPPRQILEDVPNAIPAGGAGPYTTVPELAVANGPAGASVVYWQGMEDGETAGGPVMLVTLDDWGNVITAPTPVLGEGEITTIGWVLAADADDLGYGVVTMVQGDSPGTAVLVFRHFAAAP